MLGWLLKKKEPWLLHADPEGRASRMGEKRVEMMKPWAITVIRPQSWDSRMGPCRQQQCIQFQCRSIALTDRHRFQLSMV